ncbi:MAG TPA: hypothetical protein DEG06_12075 [Lachnospiraceae bacterium]|nr:hypothetical protein [Lachnospiraceae bacterium]
MINIATHGGSLYSVNLTYEQMSHIMDDGFIKDHNFIEFEFTDGSRGSVKKDCIEFFWEREEEQEEET